jgi:hypothetical protein
VLAEALVSLASMGGSALVSAMVTDGWEGVRARLARVLGRGDKGAEERAAAQLEQSRAALAASDAAVGQVRAEQEIVWRTRLADLLERDPGAEQELRAMVSDLHALVTTSAGPVKQHVVASGHAQVAVQGQGVQNVSFGMQDGRGGTGR